jgi:hypothetical protein
LQCMECKYKVNNWEIISIDWIELSF